MQQINNDLDALASALQQAGVSLEHAFQSIRDFLSDPAVQAALAALEREADRRAAIRRLLGFDGDAPAWVQRVHETMVDAFESGNGYHEGIGDD